MQKVIKKAAAPKGFILFVIVMMSFMSCLDSSIVNAALPVIMKDLAVPLSSVEWISAAYLISICSTILIFGRLGDIIGKSKIFKLGTVLFTAGSLLSGLSGSFSMLIVSRVVQGIGASAYMANNQGLITTIYAKAGRGKALGILASAVAIGTMVGPPLGGFIVSALSWNYIFLVNIPIGVVIVVLSYKILPKDERTNKRLDISGSVLLVIAITLLFGAVLCGQFMGFNNFYLPAAIAASFVLIVSFIILQSRKSQPLLDTAIFKNKIFSLSLVCAFISFTCISAYNIIIPFYLLNALKTAPSSAGLFMMLFPMIVAVLSPLSGTLSDKAGSGLLALSGLLLMGTGFFIMSFLNENSSLFSAGIFISVLAVGQGIFQPANNSLVMSAVSQNEAGIAGSANSFVRILAQIIGVTLSTTLLHGFMSMKLKQNVFDYVEGRDDVFVYGMKNVYLILAAVCCSGTVFTAVRMFILKNRKRPE